MGPNLIGRKFQVKNFPSDTSVSGIFPCSSVCIKTFHRLGIASLYRFSSNEMDPKVAKLLEGKSDEDRIKAIAFSFGCLLTRPTANSPPDAPMKGKNLKLRSLHRTIFELILSWCTIPSQMNGERRRSREANRNIPLRNWATKKIVQVLTENFIHFIYLLLNSFVRRTATKSDCALEASVLTRGFRIAMSFRVQRKIFIGLICFSEWWMSDECSLKEIMFFCNDLFCTSSQQGIELAHEWFSIQEAQQMQVIPSKVKYHATSSGCNGSSSLFVSVSKLNNSWNYGL